MVARGQEGAGRVAIEALGIGGASTRRVEEPARRRGLLGLRLTRSFPSATTLVAKSRSIAGPAGPGTPTAWGLVPSRRAAPPHGVTLSPFTAFTHRSPTSPARAIISA